MYHNGYKIVTPLYSKIFGQFNHSQQRVVSEKFFDIPPAIPSSLPPTLMTLKLYLFTDIISMIVM